MERLAFESCVRGNQLYKDIWEASVREELLCQRENGNHADPFAVAIVKSGVTVGHIPWKISSVCSLFTSLMTTLGTECDRGPCGLRALSMGAGSTKEP